MPKQINIPCKSETWVWYVLTYQKFVLQFSKKTSMKWIASLRTCYKFWKVDLDSKETILLFLISLYNHEARRQDILRLYRLLGVNIGDVLKFMEKKSLKTYLEPNGQHCVYDSEPTSETVDIIGSGRSLLEALFDYHYKIPGGL